MGVFLAAENAMNLLWGIPFRRRPNPFRARGKALLLMLAVGTAVLAATALQYLGTFGSSYEAAWKIGSVALATGLDFLLFWAACRMLTAARVEWSETWIGAAVAAVLYQLVLALGSYYVENVVRKASAVYGTFALVIGLLSWIYLSTTILIFAAEVNVVVRNRLWPRSFSRVVQEPATSADERALEQRAEVEERRSDQRISVRWRRR
jgi:uncharacterized BrkB/YihY/UPF0761 family membrane protein